MTHAERLEKAKKFYEEHKKIKEDTAKANEEITKLKSKEVK